VLALTCYQLLAVRVHKFLGFSRPFTKKEFFHFLF